MRGFSLSLISLILMSFGLGGINIVFGEVNIGRYVISRDDFPDEFVFGAASSAYQTEGAANQDGRTPSIWDTFAHAGKMNGATGDIACDGYHKFKEDIKLMAETGLEAYRFSISWSRLIPNGRGPINPKGLQYYNNFINELLRYGIQPHVTLHHTDLPQALEDEYGGWVGRKIVKDFMAYADVCFREFGDRVKHWTTVNEANIFVLAGYDAGDLPPQRCSFTCPRGNTSTEPYIAVHHILLAHAAAARLYEAKYKDEQQGLIGLNILSYWFAPLTDSKEDAMATERAYELIIGWILNPVVFGDYPEVMRKYVGSRLPAFTAEESESLRGSFDFVGLNYYYGKYIMDIASIAHLQRRGVFVDMGFEATNMQNDSSKVEFQNTPWGMTQNLEYIKQHYNNPLIYIHENGQRTPRNSSLQDWTRIHYLQAHIGSLIDTMRNGSNVKGYFAWSLMDSFEMMDGYKSSFGFFYIDLDDPELKRQPKLSAHWYSHFLKKRKGITFDGINVQSTSHDSI